MNAGIYSHEKVLISINVEQELDTRPHLQMLYIAVCILRSLGELSILGTTVSQKIKAIYLTAHFAPVYLQLQFLEHDELST